MSKPIIKAEINENIPTIGVNVPDGNVPVLPVETIGGDSPIDLRTLTISSNSTHFEYNVLDDSYAWNKVVGDVHPITGPLNVTTNGVYDASESPYSFYGFDKVTVNVPATLPNQQLVCEYDFTSSTPKVDKVRFGVEAYSNYVTFDTTKGCIFDSASSRLLNTFYSLNQGECYKIEIEFGDIQLDSSITSGKRMLFTYSSDADKTNEGSYGLTWDVTNEYFNYYSGVGNRQIAKPLDYWKNDKMTLYYGLSVDTDGSLYLPSVNIDNSSSKSLIIMDKDLKTELTAPFQKTNPNIVLGSGNNLFYMEVKKFRIYRLNNLIEKPVL